MPDTNDTILEKHCHRIISHLEPDEILQPSDDGKFREGLRETPKRMARSLSFLTSGYEQNIHRITNNAIFDVENYDELITVSDIEFYSLCEHHILPFHGKVHVGYIPNKKIIGLSKIPRIVDMFSRRLQIQERLTTNIMEAIQTLLEPKGVGVIVQATHFCMCMRGVQKQNAYMRTSALNGIFKDEGSVAVRAEFLQLVKGSD